ncbi:MULTISPECIES: hypothetical protein [Shewanella]|uniref:Uncharacterized protein n=1 Tax=Shewanella chilikensis TaxID=558541 RepID=A0A6G7LW41_9GAMM|nr:MULTISPECIES: hypothetical protein [Shewanella]MCE9789210.1 hypothetical protein [Shewanella chilikensis]MCG9723659.1 hypothetical protein [Shewanella sp. Isolate7]MCL1155227.1 hypothetical protein [Shewanella chilikensis]MCL1160746.1 hypothetical protein [Shewanella chilikensis]PYE54001.1 hypothetical protein C8J23_1536 [Shewanella chilikensis]
MQELTANEKLEISGGMAFFVYFAAAYLGTFAGAAGFAYGAVDAMSEQK